MMRPRVPGSAMIFLKLFIHTCNEVTGRAQLRQTNLSHNLFTVKDDFYRVNFEEHG